VAERYREYVTVSGTANTETTKTLVTSTEEEPKKLLKLYVMEDTSSQQNDAIIRIYIERDRIIEFPIKVLTQRYASAEAYPEGAGEITLDRELPVGQDLIVGHLSGGTASDVIFVVEYEIM